MNNVLKVKIKSIYGQQTIYPACQQSQEFCKLLGQKSLTSNNVEHIKAIGFTLEVVQDQVRL